ncbi:MAG TPA: hypothetical protein VNJ08_03150 [Bacteriovoracaceae bacterium]|nr:hypothetical protein [Bacteriovoracaceae bacterium]
MKKLVVAALTVLTSMDQVQAFRPIPESEVTASLIEGREVTSLSEMERSGLNQGKTGIDLWSGNYWPHFQGSLAVRYRNSSVMKLIESKAQWEKFKENSTKQPLYSFLGNNDNLSPAEKYDLIVGDYTMTLTKYSWELGDKAAAIGKVPIWRGICDGWASASQMMPRPAKKVIMKTPDGQPVTFFPEDIKALGSLLYARAQENVIFLGKRCRSRALGLFTNACDETNAGTFHRALINRVGKMKKSFIADVSPGSEVWNYPVLSYDITYFNVFTEEESKDFKVAMEWFVKKNRFAKDGKRHKRTAAIVGVKAVVRYADMRPSNLLDTDDQSADKVLEKEYLYDLEIDHNFNILGGESISANLPDFIWAPNDRTYPLSEPEHVSTPGNRSELTAMARIASKKGQPLSIIVEQLFESAK